MISTIILELFFTKNIYTAIIWKAENIEDTQRFLKLSFASTAMEFVCHSSSLSNITYINNYKLPYSTILVYTLQKKCFLSSQ